MKEKRNLKRRHLIYYLEVFDRESNQLIGNLIDITPNGIKLITESPLETGQLYRLKMILPKTIQEKTELVFDAQSIRCDKDINPNFYITGFKLTNVSKDHHSIVDQLIDNSGFQD